MVSLEASHYDRNSRCLFGDDRLIGERVDAHERRKHDYGEAQNYAGGPETGRGCYRGFGRGGVTHSPHPKWSMGPRPSPKRHVDALLSAAKTNALASRVASGTLRPSASPAAS